LRRVAALEVWRLARSFLDALDVANEGAVAAALISLGRRAEPLGDDPLDCAFEPITEIGDGYGYV